MWTVERPTVFFLPINTKHTFLHERWRFPHCSLFRSRLNVSEPSVVHHGGSITTSSFCAQQNRFLKPFLQVTYVSNDKTLSFSLIKLHHSAAKKSEDTIYLSALSWKVTNESNHLATPVIDWLLTHVGDRCSWSSVNLSHLTFTLTLEAIDHKIVAIQCWCRTCAYSCESFVSARFIQLNCRMRNLHLWSRRVNLHICHAKRTYESD